jgi:hypothetical protein
MAQEKAAIQRWQPGINPIINPRAFSILMESKPRLDLLVCEKFEGDNVAAHPRLQNKPLHSVKQLGRNGPHANARA